MIVTIADQPRTWTMQRYTLAECEQCDSREFKRSKLRNTWYCSGCNEPYPEGKPSWNVMVCSTHGKQLMYNGNTDDVYWCIECEDDAFRHAYCRTESASAHYETPNDDDTLTPSSRPSAGRT